jgi:hypothetical protein
MGHGGYDVRAALLLLPELPEAHALSHGHSNGGVAFDGDEEAAGTPVISLRLHSLDKFYAKT